MQGKVKDGIYLRIDASPQLNRYREQPHAMVLAVYQLADATALRSLLAQPDGLDKLLAAEKFDGSVQGQRQLTVQPGDHSVIKMDRLENAAVFAVVAGYYERGSSERLCRLYSLQLLSEPQPFWQPQHEPHLLIEIYLDADGIITPPAAKTANAAAG